MNVRNMISRLDLMQAVGSIQQHRDYPQHRFLPGLLQMLDRCCSRTSLSIKSENDVELFFDAACTRHGALSFVTNPWLASTNKDHARRISAATGSSGPEISEEYTACR